MTDPTPHIETKDLREFVESHIKAVLDMPVSSDNAAMPDGYIAAITETADVIAAVGGLMARELGLSGYQWSVATLRALGLMRDIDGPFLLVDAEQALYPQYDLPARVRSFLASEGTRTWLADEAQKRLDSYYAGGVALDTVVEHWKKLVAQRPQTSTETSLTP